MKEKLQKTEVWFKLFLFAFFGFLYWLAMPYPEKSRQFPQLIALVSLIMIVLSLIMDFTRGTAKEEIADVEDTEMKLGDSTLKKERKKRLTRAWGVILVSTAVGFLGGFLFSTFLFFLGFALFFGKREMFWKNTAIAFGITVVVYFLFERIMGVPLLAGVLW
jgi:hypothetical protein